MAPPQSFLGRAGEAATTTSLYLEDLHPQLAVAGLATRTHEILPFSLGPCRRRRHRNPLSRTPHEQSREWAPEAIERGIRVIDLSGAWRLQHHATATVYKLNDANTRPRRAASDEKPSTAAPSCTATQIRRARLVANPGCYATSIILALAPLVQAGLVDLDHGIICDAKSGVSGAGKAPTSKTHFMYAADNLSAYAVFGHRHTGELLEQLRPHLQIRFSSRRICCRYRAAFSSTIYVRLRTRTEAGCRSTAVLPRLLSRQPAGAASHDAAAAADPARRAHQLL